MSKPESNVISPNYSQKSNAEFNAELSEHMWKACRNLEDKSIDLAIRVREARDFIDWHCDHMKNTWLDWIEQSDKMLESMRQSRIALGTEQKLLLSMCADVRKFFLADEHEQEIARLRDFIELAERLKALKRDGTLDALADTILKL